MNTHLPDYFLTDIVAVVAFGLLAILLLVFGFKVFDKLTPNIAFDETLNKGNIAVAIVIGAFLLGISYIVASVLSAVLG